MFQRFITFNNLVTQHDKILISFSGGPDSVFMTEKFLEIKEKFDLILHLVYVNHNVRKDVSKDIEIVYKISEKYNLNYTILEINKNKDNLSEEKLRNLRYEAIENLRKELKFDKIATGHNKNDNAETIIFKILRGTSKDGLKGLNIQRDNIIRPILCFEKEYILENVKNEYSIDETNLENIYSRNIIRNVVFPVFKEINSKFMDNIINLYDNLEENEIKKYIINELKKYNIQLNRKKINDIYNIYTSGESKMIDLNKEYCWYKSYDKFVILKKSEIQKENKEIILKYKEEIDFNGYTISFNDFDLLEKNSKNIYNIYSHYNLNQNSSFIVRNRKNGDKLGNKKIKKIFIDNKIDKLERDRIPVIEFNSQIIMVGDKFSLKSEENEKKLCISIRRKNGK